MRAFGVYKSSRPLRGIQTVSLLAVFTLLLAAAITACGDSEPVETPLPERPGERGDQRTTEPEATQESLGDQPQLTKEKGDRERVATPLPERLGPAVAPAVTRRAGPEAAAAGRRRVPG